MNDTLTGSQTNLSHPRIKPNSTYSQPQWTLMNHDHNSSSVRISINHGHLYITMHQYKQTLWQLCHILNKWESFTDKTHVWIKPTKRTQYLGVNEHPFTNYIPAILLWREGNSMLWHLVPWKNARGGWAPDDGSDGSDGSGFPVSKRD